MRVKQSVARPGQPIQKVLDNASLVLAFGGRSRLSTPSLPNELAALYPGAVVVGCSTAGEIAGTQVYDNTLVTTAIQFERTHVVCYHEEIAGRSCRAVGLSIASKLELGGLVHAFVLCDGTSINCSDLVRGITQVLPDNVRVTGGLAGDGEHFAETLVLCGPTVSAHSVCILGLYGSSLQVGYGSVGGWDCFGPERVITKSEGNVLYEMDGRNALELYKVYLGEHAAKLPASGLLFPLAIRYDAGSPPLVRTILGVDESEQALIFAGDVPVGAYAQLMRANLNRLVDGAGDAATASLLNSNPEFAILVSCVGRRMVLKQRVEEEVEAVGDVLGESTVLAGFYSYGEIAPTGLNGSCELHNQTMTITTFTEH